MGLWLWDLEPRSISSLPVNNVDTGIMKLVLHLGSVDQGRRYLADWNLVHQAKDNTGAPFLLPFPSLLHFGPGFWFPLTTPGSYWVFEIG